MIVIIMGVSGSGKTTIGKKLAASLHWQFVDADSFHSPDNIEKMRRGIPLDDVDRRPWLEALQAAIKNWLQQNQNTVLACSALKSSYRQFLIMNNCVKIVYLKGSFELIQERLKHRQNHFMTEKLLKSQFDSLEEPDDAISVDISQSPESIVDYLQNIFN